MPHDPLSEAWRNAPFGFALFEKLDAPSREEAPGWRCLGANPAFAAATALAPEALPGKALADWPPHAPVRRFDWTAIDRQLADERAEVAEDFFCPQRRRWCTALFFRPAPKQIGLQVVALPPERQVSGGGLQDQSALQELLMNIATKYINIDLADIDRRLHQSLGELARFVEADRAYLFDYDWQAGTTSNTHEWCAEGIEPQIEELQDIPLEYVPQWVETHRRGETMYVPDVLSLPPDDGVRAILEPQDIKSLIAIPILHRGEALGFVGFDSVRAHHRYSEKERSLLRVFAEIVVNIRNRLGLERTLIEEKQKAQAANRAKSDFLANMSHEIRTPLNGIIGFLELVRKTELTPVQAQYLETVATSSQSLLSVINDILDFSKIEAGKLELDAVRTDVQELLDQTIDIVKLSAAQKGLELLVDLPADIPRYARVDPARLSQVLVNLLGNAVKFTEQGEVELQLRFEPLDEGRGRFHFAVRDTGIGISPEQQTRLFKAFSQADTSTTRQFGGTGLGLVIANYLVGQMGGTIRLRSAPGEGSTFFFAIEADYEAGERPSRDTLQHLRRLLVVDDHPKNRELLEALLREWGLEVVACENALQAMSALSQDGSFDAALVDYHMPFVDGLETIRMLRDKLGFTPAALPVVLLHSSADSEELRQSCQALGVAFELVKPVKSRLLRQYLAALQEEAGTEAAQEALPAPEAEAASGLSPGEGATVLVAEDVGTNRVLVKSLLRYLMPEARILEATDGREALALFRREKPDLVLMDVQMPHLSGLEVTESIRAEEAEPRAGTASRTPIVALTAGAVKEEEARCRAVGMDGFLTKPLMSDALAEALHAHLPAFARSG